jgi:hypothetical protein
MHRRARLASPAAACLALALVAPLAAAPLDLAAVPADAKWLMHFDMDAARDSVVVTRAWDRMLKMHPHADGMVDMVARMTGMDPRKDVRDATAYGLDTDKRNGVLIVRAKVNREFLTRMVEKAADHKTMKHGDYTLHAWTHKRGRHSGPAVGAFYKDDVLVFARTEAAVANALDVLDGRRGPVAGDAPLAGRVRPGSIVVARATAVDPDTRCPVLKQGRAFRVAFGEADAMKLVDGAKTAVDGSTCTISWDAAAEDVWKVVDRAADAWEKRHRDRRHGRNRDGSCAVCGKDGCGGCGRGECPVTKRAAPAEEKPLREEEF